MNVRQRGGDDARGERAGVQLVVGVQDQRDIECLCGRAGGLNAVEHAKGSWLHGESDAVGRRPAARSLRMRSKIGDDHGDLRGETEALAQVGGVIGKLFVGVVDGEERDGGAEDLHGGGLGGERTEELVDAPVEGAGLGQLGREGFELFGVGEAAVPEEVGGFFEAALRGEFVDVDAAIGEDAGVAVDVADGGGGGDNAFKALGGGSESGHEGQSPSASYEWMFGGVWRAAWNRAAALRDQAESTYGYSPEREGLSRAVSGNRLKCARLLLCGGRWVGS